VTRPALAISILLVLLGCYDLGGGRLGGDDDDSGSLDDDDSAIATDDDDSEADPCVDDPEPELITIDDECRIDLEIGSEMELEIVWQYGLFETEPGYDQVMMTPIVVPLTDDDGDGVPSPGDARSVLFTTYTGGAYSSDGILRALRGDGSGLLWTVTDPAWRLHPGAQLAAGDIDGDGWPEVVGAHQSGYLAAFDRAGNPLWLSPDPLSGSGGAPFLADMDGDGAVEIVYGNQVFDAAGNLLGAGVHGTAATYSGTEYGASVVVDLNLDGVQEVVVGNALYDMYGSALWFNGQPDGVPGVGNFDADPEGEVVVVSSGEVRVQDTNGDVLSGPVALPGPGSGGPPTVADFDGDNWPEVGVANLGFYTLFDTDLTVLWTNPTEDDSSALTGSSAFDFDNDGASEVVYADEHDVWVWHGATGVEIHRGSGHASGTLIEYPVVARVLDGDGPPQIVVASNDMWWEGWTGVTLLADSGRSWTGTRQVWNQHAYMPTHVEPDLSIPASPMMPWLAGQGLRQNEVSSSHGVAAADLSLELHGLCPEFCSVRVRPLNTGIDAGPMAVGLLADGEPIATVPLDGLPGGTRDAVLEFALDAETVAAASELMVWIDAMDDVQECDETNNQLVLPPLSCP